MAVRPLVLDKAVADCATASGAIDDRNRRRQFASHAVGEMTRGDVDGAPRSHQYRHFDRFSAWELLGCCRCNNRRAIRTFAIAMILVRVIECILPPLLLLNRSCFSGRLLHAAQRWGPFVREYVNLRVTAADAAI